MQIFIDTAYSSLNEYLNLGNDNGIFSGVELVEKFSQDLVPEYKNIFEKNG